MTAGPDLLRALRAKLRRDMPITRALGLRVVGHEGGGLVLSSPLEPNINHKGTAFAGSLNATATLAGWGTIWLALREHGIRSHVVIQDSTVHYFRPVTGDFTARCKAPSATGGVSQRPPSRTNTELRPPSTSQPPAQKNRLSKAPSRSASRTPVS